MTMESAVWLTKFLHVSMIALWAGGLLALPFLLAARRGLAGEPLHRLHEMARRLFIQFVSPAAFLAIASGVGLVFLRQTFVEWFSAKLAFVGLLAALHSVTGRALVAVFTEERRFGPLAAAGLTTGQLIAILPILWLVLAKPALDADSLHAELFAPGRLGELLAPLIAWARP